ncbi:MAG TPA: hypothetical protein PKA47_17735, partial [Accumulibacter sp.]|uniref:hypothetical protein n=1 Tax=Accumulibacter sp. TaxID=2053492 RepID=UPI002BC36F49
WSGQSRILTYLNLSEQYCTKPSAFLSQKVTEGRGFAVAVAQIKRLADEVGLYKRLVALTKAASVRSMAAPARREDMREVIEEAKSLE